jgi:hypothetical protein
MAIVQKIFMFLGQGQHRIKQNAEQFACKDAIENIKRFNDFADVIDNVQQKHNIYNDTNEDNSLKCP